MLVRKGGRCRPRHVGFQPLRDRAGPIISTPLSGRNRSHPFERELPPIPLIRGNFDGLLRRQIWAPR